MDKWRIIEILYINCEIKKLIISIYTKISKLIIIIKKKSVDKLIQNNNHTIYVIEPYRTEWDRYGSNLIGRVRPHVDTTVFLLVNESYSSEYVISIWTASK